MLLKLVPHIVYNIWKFALWSTAPNCKAFYWTQILLYSTTGILQGYWIYSSCNKEFYSTQTPFYSTTGVDYKATELLLLNRTVQCHFIHTNPLTSKALPCIQHYNCCYWTKNDHLPLVSTYDLLSLKFLQIFLRTLHYLQLHLHFNNLPNKIHIFFF
jgi:hypothetical protein